MAKKEESKINEIVVDQTEPVITSKINPEEIVSSSEEAAEKREEEKTTEESVESVEQPEPVTPEPVDITQTPEYQQLLNENSQYKSLLEPIVSDQEKYNSFMGIITDNPQNAGTPVTPETQPQIPQEPVYDNFSDVDDYQKAMAKYNRDIREYDRKEMRNSFKEEFSNFKTELERNNEQQKAEIERQSAKTIIGDKYKLTQQDFNDFDQWLKKPKTPLEANELATKLFLLENGRLDSGNNSKNIIPPKKEPKEPNLPNVTELGGGDKESLTENEIFNKKISSIFERTELKL